MLHFIFFFSISSPKNLNEDLYFYSLFVPIHISLFEIFSRLLTMSFFPPFSQSICAISSLFHPNPLFTKKLSCCWPFPRQCPLPLCHFPSYPTQISRLFLCPLATHFQPCFSLFSGFNSRKLAPGTFCLYRFLAFQVIFLLFNPFLNFTNPLCLFCSI